MNFHKNHAITIIIIWLSICHFLVKKECVYHVVKHINKWFHFRNYTDTDTDTDNVFIVSSGVYKCKIHI